MRWLVYWSVVVTVAVMVAHAAGQPQETTGLAVAATRLPQAIAVPEERALLLGLGILAIAYTYQRVWQNFRRARG